MTIPSGVIEAWPIASIKPYAKNAKKHSPEQVSKLAALIGKYGWTNLITVQKSTGLIIAGHGRRLAAIELGVPRVAVNVLDVSDEAANALRLADNRIASTDYDSELLRNEIIDLSALGLDLGDLGFDAKELDFLTGDIGGIDESAFTDDITAAVEDQKTENAAAQEAADEAMSGVGKALGFTKLTSAQARRVKAFMSRVEDSTGLRGVDALMAHLSAQGVA